VRDLNFSNAGCEPRRGPSGVVPLVRRGLRLALRPMLARLVEILNDLSDRLDAAEARVEAAREQADAARKRIDHVHTQIRHTESRLDQAELRLDAAERNGEILRALVEALRARSDGMTVHLEGLTREHHNLNARSEVRAERLEAVAGLDRRQDELDEQLRAFAALHWDHVALARRLAVIEDVLAGSPVEAGPRPSIPFPGFEDEARPQAG
jgi:chromosome segregation ATPase